MRSEIACKPGNPLQQLPQWGFDKIQTWQHHSGSREGPEAAILLAVG